MGSEVGANDYLLINVVNPDNDAAAAQAIAVEKTDIDMVDTGQTVPPQDIINIGE